MNKTLFISFFYILLSLTLQAQSSTHISNKEDKKKQKPPPVELNFSLNGGFYDEVLSIELNSPGATIYFTLDGSVPNRSASKYTKAIPVKETSVIRAVAYLGKRKSKIFTNSYFINEPASTFPVVSLAISPSVLFDPETGLYVKGPNAIDSLWKKDGANFWSKREVLMNTEIFEANGGNGIFNSVSGFRLFGGMSRLFPQKSMTIVTRDRYGKKRIRHRIFGKEGLKEFKYLVLRNSGSDWGKSHFRDAMMTGLLEEWDIEKQDSRPAHVYLNGTYWGIYNIREKINRYFLESHTDLHKDSVDLIEHRHSLKRGSRKHYLNMLNYLKKNSLAEADKLAYLKSMMEVDNFMNYQIAQIFFDNRDAGGNIKFWRPQTDNGKWRWILYDTDWGFGLHDSEAYKFNSLSFHTASDGPDWPNPPWSTFILRKLLENPEFQDDFINRFCDHLNTTFESKRILDHIDFHVNRLNPEIDRHLDRWRLYKKRWKTHIRRMQTFARRRQEFIQMHLMEQFNTGKLAQLEIESSIGGKTIINNYVELDNNSFKGTYFEKIPVTLRVIPHMGYRFSHWEGMDSDEKNLNLSLKLNPQQPLRLKAVFERYEHPLNGKVVINEISCNNKETGDWVEIYNNSDQSVDLSNWRFTDTKNEFKIGSMKIPAKDYYILCQDIDKFKKHFPEKIHLAGNLDFGLHKRREHLGLFSQDGAAVDSISYELAPKDSAFTFSLLLPWLDNSDLENWEIKDGFGTPESANPYYLESRIRSQQELWLRVGLGMGFLLCCFLAIWMRKYMRKPKLVLSSGQTIELEIEDPQSRLPKKDDEDSSDEEELPIDQI